MSDNYTPRRKRLDLSRFDTMQMHVRHPLIALWWATSFAGFGQMMVGSYVKGYLLVILEIIINIQAHLNLAITELEQKGIAKEKILAIPFVQEHKDFAILDTIHRADGVSIFDTASVFATTGMTLGVIYGFVWYWGPIIWGLIGLLGRAAVGFALDYLFTKRKISIQSKAKVSELVLIINCDKTQGNLVEKILRNNTAFGVGIVKA